MMGLEPDVENPADSDIFNRYRRFTADKQAVHFVCDTLRVAVSGGIPPFDLDQMIDVDLETHEQHADQPAHSLATIADALPGLGIVAAVLGIVISMSSLGGPPEELGFKVASALVGTFLGVLTSYGFVSPIASAMQARHETESAYFRTLKAGLIAFVKGHPPILALEFARRAIPPDVRPTFKEMESKCRSS